MMSGLGTGGKHPRSPPSQEIEASQDVLHDGARILFAGAASGAGVDDDAGQLDGVAAEFVEGLLQAGKVRAGDERRVRHARVGQVGRDAGSVHPGVALGGGGGRNGG